MLMIRKLHEKLSLAFAITENPIQIVCLSKANTHKHVQCIMYSRKGGGNRKIINTIKEQTCKHRHLIQTFIWILFIVYYVWFG